MAVKKRSKTTKKVVRVKPNKTRRNLVILGVIVVAIPITLLLLAQPQDNRQEAATVNSDDLYITTAPNDTLNVTITQQNGNVIKSTDPGQGNSGDGGTGTTRPRRTRQTDQSGGDQTGTGQQGNCDQQNTTQKSDNGSTTKININCNGGQQFNDNSGSDGNNQAINKNGGNTSQPKNSTSKDTKRTTNNTKSTRGSLLQRILEKFRGFRM